MNRRDAMDAEEGGSLSPEDRSLKSGWFERPPPPSALCAAIAEIARRLRRISQVLANEAVASFSVAALPRCAHRVSAFLLHASGLNGYGSAGLLVPVGRSSIGAFCFPWLLLVAIGLAAASPAAELYVRQPGWVETLMASRRP